MNLILIITLLVFTGVKTQLSLCKGRRSHRNCKLLPLKDQCGVPGINRRVVGGHNAKLGQFPWLSILHYSGVNSSSRIRVSCGGSIINDRYIVSAAHCYNEPRVPTIRVGEYDLSTSVDCEEGECEPPFQDLEVDSVIVHEDYNPTSLDNDIMLIRLKKRLRFNKFVSPICLPLELRFKNERYVGKNNLEVAGWGIYKQNDMVSETPTVVQTAELSLVRRRQCKVPEGMLCAIGDKGQDACNGDSGGPLMGQYSLRPRDPDLYYLVGIVSWGPTQPCGQAGEPGVYTDVRHFMPWILDNIRN